MKSLLILLPLLLAHDDGRYAQSPLHDWFNSLTNQSAIPCCDTADGRRIDDADWGTEGDHFKVRVDGVWYPVPPEAVVKGVNKAGTAIVWPFRGPDGIVHIRCFMPGTYT